MRDGYADGTEDGYFVGFTEGICVIAADGVKDGDEDGRIDGFSVGTIEGVLVVVADGKKDGSTEGICVIVADGVKVGDEDGRIDGFSVGTIERWIFCWNHRRDLSYICRPGERWTCRWYSGWLFRGNKRRSMGFITYDQQISSSLSIPVKVILSNGCNRAIGGHVNRLSKISQVLRTRLDNIYNFIIASNFYKNLDIITGPSSHSKIFPVG